MQNNALTRTHLVLDPYVPDSILLVALGLLVLGCALMLKTHKTKVLFRLFGGLILLALLANPSRVDELHKPVKDVAAVIIDRSPSQNISDRNRQTADAQAWLQKQFQQFPNLEVRIAETQGSPVSPVTETSLFDTYENIWSDVPEDRRAGTIIISDGQIVDVPKQARSNQEPLHLLLTGQRDEYDLQLKLINAPNFGITGKPLLIKYSVEDKSGKAGDTISVTLKSSEGVISTRQINLNEEQQLEIPVNFPGQNVFELSIPTKTGELTILNNRAVFSVNGVRDRLKVLLVSGEPHPGGRAWRDMFKADSGVDLVHFTILRSPMERDLTPQNELSLIAFPIRELFEVKLKEFDLIVLDRFHLNNLLPDVYFQNLRDYVENGGALLEVSGPSFYGEESLYNTALGTIFPTRPAGPVVRSAFKPQLTKLGKIHPVTQSLSALPDWGPWLQHVPVEVINGDVLMTASNEKPLLILNHVKKGRIAQLASDQIWLWSRHYEGGGPTRELLRRTVHWLMKEPELEEDALDVRATDQSLIVKRRQLKEDALQVDVTAPDGSKKSLELKPENDGWLTAKMSLQDQGIYEFSSGQHHRMIAYGDYNSPEMRQLFASDEILKPLIKSTLGTIIRLSDVPNPELRMLEKNRRYGGNNWLALRKNGSTVLTGVKQSPLLQPWLAALLGLSIIVGMWWFESRSVRPRKLVSP